MYTMYIITLTVPNPPSLIQFCTHPGGLGLKGMDNIGNVGKTASMSTCTCTCTCTLTLFESRYTYKYIEGKVHVQHW